MKRKDRIEKLLFIFSSKNDLRAEFKATTGFVNDYFGSFDFDRIVFLHT
jgi:hypothetical protein